MTLRQWEILYVCLVAGLVSAIVFFHLMMPVLPRAPILKPDFPRLRLKMPEPPPHKRVRVADMC